MRRQLLSLPFETFACYVAHLLEAMGYEQVRLMGATHSRGRNAYGGLDLQAIARSGLTSTRVIAQIKQYHCPVPRSFVDELRGAMLRLGAQQGLLITTSEFAKATAEAAQSVQHSLPVRLIDGIELVALLRQYGVQIGVLHSNPPVPKRQERRKEAVSASAPAVSPTKSQSVTLTLTVRPSGEVEMGLGKGRQP